MNNTQLAAVIEKLSERIASLEREVARLNQRQAPIFVIQQQPPAYINVPAPSWQPDTGNPIPWQQPTIVCNT